MKIAIGCDHGALALKNKVVAHLLQRGFQVEDVGTYTPDSCDYADYAAAAARLHCAVHHRHRRGDHGK